MGTDANQILINSDRITLNTKLNDIFISSKRDVHIGGGINLSLSSNNSMIFQTPEVNIGNPNKSSMQPMVLGDALKNVLENILDLISKLEINTSLGPQTALISTGQVGFGGPKLEKKITDITTQINNITSNFHKIQSN